MKFKPLIFIACFLLCLSLIIAQPPFEQGGDFNEGFEIKYQPFGYLKQNTNHTFYFHVFNISNGYPIIKGIACDFHLYKPNTPYHLFIGNVNIPDDVYDYEISVDAGNFTDLGYYSYIFQCNDTHYGGFESVEFIITSNGQKPADTNFMIFIYSMFIFIVVVLLFMFVINIGKLATMSGTIYDIGISWSFYFILIINYYLAKNYLIDSFIVDNVSVYLSILGFTSILLPVFSLIVTMFYKMTTKKSVISTEEIIGRRLLHG